MGRDIRMVHVGLGSVRSRVVRHLLAQRYRIRHVGETDVALLGMAAVISAGAGLLTANDVVPV